jgi:hypothetical protein
MAQQMIKVKYLFYPFRLLSSYITWNDGIKNWMNQKKIDS